MPGLPRNPPHWIGTYYGGMDLFLFGQRDNVFVATEAMSLLPKRHRLPCHTDNASLATGAMSLLPQRQIFRSSKKLVPDELGMV